MESIYSKESNKDVFHSLTTSYACDGQTNYLVDMFPVHTLKIVGNKNAPESCTKFLLVNAFPDTTLKILANPDHIIYLWKNHTCTNIQWSKHEGM